MNASEPSIEVAARLSDDPAVAISIAGWEQYGPAAVAGVANRLPVALFEPRTAVAATLPGGTTVELQTEMIIQAGFTRWRQRATFDFLPEWTVQRIRDGLELRNHDGVWARGSASLSTAWLAEAQRHGVVLAVYGTRLGVRPPARGYSRPQDQAAELRRAREVGAVAGAIIGWQDLPVPEVTHYPGPSYNPATGQFDIAFAADGPPARWYLNKPGVGVCHGLVLGGQGTGKTNVLSLIVAEAVQSNVFTLWLADPSGRRKLSDVWGSIADRIASTPTDTVEMLDAAATIVKQRSDTGNYTDPSVERPGLIVLVDEGQEVFAGNPRATRLAEHIVDDGGQEGVGLVVSSRGPDMAYFGGSRVLRDRLASVNCYVLGRDALDTLHKIKDASSAGES